MPNNTQIKLSENTTEIQLMQILQQTLLRFIREDPSRQEDTVYQIGNSGIVKLFNQLTHEKQTIRKLACLIICELVWRNQRIQKIVCQLFSFTPVNGKIAINPFPRKLSRLIEAKPQTLKLIQQSSMKSGKYWCFPPVDPKKTQQSLKDISLFPDPLESLIGFYSANNQEAPLNPNNHPKVPQDPIQSKPTPKKFTRINRLSQTQHKPSKSMTNPDTENEENQPPDQNPQLSHRKPILRHLNCSAIKPSQTNKSMSPKTITSIEKSIQRIRGALTKIPTSRSISPKRQIPSRQRVPSTHRKRLSLSSHTSRPPTFR